MRKLIRSKSTGAFLTVDEGWANDLASAREFTEERQAIEAAQRLRLKGVELYYSFRSIEVAPWDFTIPLEVKPAKSSFWTGE
jgi:hypothetical protein